jgi:hypothetical protein
MKDKGENPKKPGLIINHVELSYSNDELVG